MGELLSSGTAWEPHAHTTHELLATAALGVVAVGTAVANFGDDCGDGLLPWVAEKLDERRAETPVPRCPRWSSARWR